MTKKYNQDLLKIVLDNKVNMQWYGKVCWMSIYDPRVSDSKTSNEVHVKLKDGVGREETIIEGLRLLGIAV